MTSNERTSNERTAIVAGGGIGGLAAAAALSRRGWRVEVLERASTFGEVGAGISLWPNGIRALEALGIGHAVRDHSMPETEAGIRDPRGRWLSRTDTAELVRRHGAPLMMHRAHLLDLVRDAASGAVLRSDTAVETVRSGGAHVEVVHGQGVSRADLLVGADGIRSTVRRSLWPDAPEPRYAGYTSWRAVIDPGPDAVPTAGGETWGRGERLGLATLPDGRIYLFGVANVAAGTHAADGELAELRRRFGGWHAPVPQLLTAVAETEVMRHDICALPPLDTFVASRVALLGDAAHAMTPNLGQGANQALEDAVTLAAVLDEHSSVEAALVAYDAERRPRTQMIARRSDQIGAVAQWSSPLATALRDGLLRLTPTRSVVRSLEPVLGWRPPGVTRGT